MAKTEFIGDVHWMDFGDNKAVVLFEGYDDAGRKIDESAVQELFHRFLDDLPGYRFRKIKVTIESLDE